MRRRWDKAARTPASALAVLACVVTVLVALTGGASALTGPPTIASDKADYGPGDTVTLTGTNWQPGESVHIVVNDDQGQTWKHEADVTGAGDGTIIDQFQLPNWFVASYSVTATGAESGTATTSFTDANPALHVLGSDTVAHQTAATEENLGSFTQGTNLVLTCPRGTGLTTQVTGNGGGNTVNWSLAYVTSYADDATLSPKTTLNPSSGSFTGNGSTCVAMTMTTSTLGAATYHGELQITGTGGSPTSDVYFFKLTVTATDTTAPTSAITFPAGAGYNSTGWAAGCATAGFCGTAGDTGTGATGVKKVELSLRRGTGNYWDPSANAGAGGFTSASELFFAATGTTSWSYAFPFSKFPADDSYTLRSRATDNANNVETPHGVTFTIDSTAPAAPTITSSPTSPGTGRSPSWAFSGESGGSFQCSLTRGATTVFAFAGCTSPKSYDLTAQPDGTYTFHVKQTDAAGNTGAEATSDYVLDTTAPPAPTIDSHPSDPTNSTNASFGFSDSESGVSFLCQLDGGGFSACTSPKTYTVVEGTHSFDVKAKDAAGNESGATSFSWLVDTTPPDTSITSHPSDPSGSSSASFDFSGTDSGGSGVDHFECKLDTAAFATCTSPASHSGLAEGSHTFQVRAVDKAGNTDPTPASFTWLVDTKQPSSSASSPPFNGSSTITVQYTASDPSPSSGLDKVELWAKGPNDTAYSKAATDDAPGSSGSFSYDASEGQGSYSFYTRALDKAGNYEDPPFAADGITIVADTTTLVDLTPPASQANSPAYSAATTFSVGYTASDTGSGVAKVELWAKGPTDLLGYNKVATDNAPGSSGSFSYIALQGDGNYSFYTVATDKAGNTELPPSPPGTADTTTLVDTVPPDTTITSQPNDPSGSSSASFSFGGTDPSPASGIDHFECKLDAAAFAACASPASYTSLADASHTFQVRAVDKAGNTDPSPATFTWLVDTTPPDTTITSSPADPTNSTSASFSFTGTDSGGSGVDRFECKLDSGSFGGCSSPKMYSGLSEGSHTFEVRADDKAGNTDPSPASFTWLVDTTPPDTTITGSPADPTNSTSASFSFTGTDSGGSGVDRFECKLDAAAFATCTSPASYSGLAEGSHTFQVRAIDKAGNADASPASFTWLIDTTPPDTTITSNPADPSGSSSASFAFNGTDPSPASGVDRFECKLDAAAFATCTSPASYSGLADGSHTFQVRAVDKAGNTDPTPASFTWLVDTKAPSATITFPANSGSYNAATWDSGCGTPAGDICGTASDTAGGSGVQVVKVSIKRMSDGYYWSGTTWTSSATEVFVDATTTSSWSTWSYAMPSANFAGSDGNYTVHAKSVDRAANESTVASATFFINAPPSVSAGGPYTVNEGTAITLIGSASSDATTYSWSYTKLTGNATTTCAFGSPTSKSTSFTCNDNGTFKVTFTASDGVNSSSSDAIVTVNNVAPTITITSPSNGTITVVGAPVSLSANLSDAGRNDTHTCTINWGDGITSTATVTESGGAGKCQGTHTYAVKSPPGGYQITATATDDDGGVRASSPVTITVR
jgi:hypothetical protein